MFFNLDKLLGEKGCVIFMQYKIKRNYFAIKTFFILPGLQ